MDVLNQSKAKISKSEHVRLGISRTDTGWQFGLFSKKDSISLCFCDKNGNKIIKVDVTREYKMGDIFSFVVNEKLDGLYLTSSDEGIKAYAKSFAYMCGENADNKDTEDYFGRERKQLVPYLEDESKIYYETSPEQLRQDKMKHEMGNLTNANNYTHHAAKDMLIYKLHVRGFTKLCTRIDEKERGTFKALGRRVSYFEKLGFNTVLLMPSYEFNEVPVATEDEMNCYRTGITNKINYWGYTDGFYYAPKRAYSSSENVMLEFSQMVNNFHRNNINVLMEFYFRDEMAPSVVTDILRFWKETYRIDGFRIIGSDMCVFAAKTDPVLSDSIIIASDFGNDTFYNGTMEKNYTNKDRLIWYDEGYMEAVRHFLRGDDDSINEFTNKMIRHQYGFPTLNFIAEHDCFSIMDMVSFERRHNEINGENNCDGRKNNISFNCGVEGKTKKQSIVKLRLKYVKSALLMLFMSSSVPMLMAGDEFGMSHEGNNNPYCQDNEINYIDWSLLEKNEELFEYVRGLIKFRREYPCIHPGHDFSMCDHMNKGMPDLSFHTERAWYPMINDYTKNVGMLYCGAYENNSKNVYILYNMHTYTHDFAMISSAGKEWKVAIASDETDVAFIAKRRCIRLQPHSAAVLVSQ